MLPDAIDLLVVTPERQIVSETVTELQLPGLGGYLGILPGHAPLITELGVGALSYPKGGSLHYLTIIHGYAEVLGDRVVVLAEISERAEEIDADRARSAEQRAEKHMAKQNDPDVDWDRAIFALERALLRQQVAAKADAVTHDEHSHAAP